MKKKKITLLATIVIAHVGICQINTPSQTIQGSTGATSTNVGIGTLNRVNPNAKLEIQNNGNQLRLSNTSSVFSDINTTSTGHLVFMPGTTTGKIAFGISAPASGVGFHSNMGIFRISDNASVTKALQVTPNYAGNGEIPSGVILHSISTTNFEGLSFLPTSGATAGVKLGAYAYSLYGWKSVWETANVNAVGVLPNLLLVKNAGNVGIGTSNPREKLEVNGNARIGADGVSEPSVDPNTALTIYQSGSGKKALKFRTWDNSLPVIYIENTNFPNKSLFTVYGNGFTRIGEQTPLAPHTDAHLAVSGKIVCQSLYVLNPTSWADFVFKNKDLEKLETVEKYINENKHLPGIPSEEEIYANGYNINEIDAKLLEKIETLYLHIISLEKEIKELKKN